MKAPRSVSSWLLALIVFCYLVLGTLYAVLTPKWQAPDEPAHFNYIKHLAENGQLPVLQPGDYPYQYLEDIKAAKFPPSMSISAIRYESHQPPLYYALGALLYRLTSALGPDVQFFTLRLFSVILGALVLVTAHQVVCTVFPVKPFLALAATAFIAIVPMHITFTAAINNDTLAELVLLLILWRSVRIVRTSLDTRQAIITGILLGLALLTKTTIYVSLGVVAVAVLLHPAPKSGLHSTVMRKKVSHLLLAFILALLISAPWFVRNASVYGNLDIFGWQRHDTVVEGQLRTVDFLSSVGPASYAKAFVFTTFRSFWGQFGWMGVLMDERLYLALALMSGLLGLGFIAYLIRVRKREASIRAATCSQHWCPSLWQRRSDCVKCCDHGPRVTSPQCCWWASCRWPCTAPSAVMSPLGVSRCSSPGLSSWPVWRGFLDARGSLWLHCMCLSWLWTGCVSLCTSCPTYSSSVDHLTRRRSHY